MSDILSAAEPVRKRALLQAHPVLGGQAARRGEIDAHSRSEQAGLGLDRMEGDEEAAFLHLNGAYLERFGFPFIIAVRGQRGRGAILAALRQRFESSLEVERETALAEVIKIAGFRLEGLIAEEQIALTLSLHVLDTAAGLPGSGLAFTLVRIEGEEARVPLAGGMTDGAGRWSFDRAIALLPAVYELAFEAGAYQAERGRDSFYDRIAIRFRMRAEGGHYHIPLILSPFGYSTYRGG